MRITILILSCCAALALAACDASTDDNMLNVGVVLPFTGLGEDAGDGVLKGMEFAREELNGSGRLGNAELAFITQDNKSTTDGSEAAFTKLITEDRVEVIVGPLSSSSTSRVTSIADNAGVVFFSPSSSAAGLGAASKWLFRSSLTVEHLVPHGVMVSKKHLDYRRVATIHNDGDTYSISSHSKFMEMLTADADITIVAEQSYSRPPGTSIGDLTTELSAILNANPDVIFLSGQPEDQFGVITQGHVLGIADTPYISPLLSVSMVERINTVAAGAAEKAVAFQIWLASSTNGLSRAFVSGFTARYGKAPNDWAARGYATMQILGAGLADSDNYQAAAIQTALAGTKTLETIFGTFSFDENGDAVYDPIVSQLQNNEFVILE